MTSKLREARVREGEISRRMEEEEEDMVNGLLRKLEKERGEREALEMRIREAEEGKD